MVSGQHATEAWKLGTCIKTLKETRLYNPSLSSAAQGKGMAHGREGTEKLLFA